MSEKVTPFLKWPGGKRWLVPFLRSEVLRDIKFLRYFEPFLGGAAVFFGIQPPLASLSDINGDLINTYLQVKERPEALVERLRTMPVDRATYHTIRAASPTDPIDQAVRFLYLNRTAFGGMYRLDRTGKFNVPFGGGDRTPEVLWSRGLLIRASAALQHATLRAMDFQEAISEATFGDLVYCDPTYTVAHNNNGFVRYNERNFSWNDQQRLAWACQEAAHRGAVVLVSNAFHMQIAHLYPHAEVRVLPRKSLLARDPSKRRLTSEYLFILQPASHHRKLDICPIAQTTLSDIPSLEE